MKSKQTKDISRIFSEGTLIDKALQDAVREARRQHKLAGHSVVEWRDGEVVWVPPDEIDVEPPPRRKR